MPANEQHVPNHNHAHDKRQQHDVPQHHLTDVDDVEPGAETDRVEPVLGLGGDPLRVEVRLHQVTAVPIEARNDTTPVIHVIARRPRHAAIQNLPQRCTTMKTKNNSTPHRCTLFTKCPTADT